MKHLLVLAALLAAPSVALADPFTIIGFAIAGAAATGAITALTAFYLTVGVAIAGAADARRKARKAAARQRAEYNAGLSDRTLTMLSSDPVQRVVYGRAICGGDIVAMFTTDKTTVGDYGYVTGRADALKHLVIVFAAHECQDIHELYIDGVPVGPTVNGYPVSGQFATDNTVMGVANTSGGMVVLPHPAAEILSVLTPLVGGGDMGESGGQPVAYTLAPDRKLITLAEGSPDAEVRYTYKTDVGFVRWSKHLGTENQEVDGYLHGLIPDKWTTDHRLAGLTYAVVTLDLENSRFQGGPPNILADISGRKVLDTRTGVTTWTANNALIIRDFLLAPWGYECDESDIDNDYCNAAANACDVERTYTVGSEAETGPTYTLNGAFTTAESRESILEDMCDSMAGYAVYGGQWRIIPGAWAPPVTLPGGGGLTDADLDGQIEIVTSGATNEEIYNGVRGTYIPKGKMSPTDYQPYSNATFVEADGRELWVDVPMPYTDNKARCTQLARIFTERVRSGLVIRYPAKLRAWPLQVGDRVTVTSAEYGFAAKLFKVTDWQFSITSPVVLTLQEDDPSIYDVVDAVSADPTPNTTLPNPWVVPTVQGLQAHSGTDQLLRTGDGTVAPRILVAWDKLTAPYMQGAAARVEVLWQVGSGPWAQINVAPAVQTAHIVGVQEGQPVTIQVRVRNSLGAVSDSRFLAHRVIGKTAPASAVTTLGATQAAGGVDITWDPCTDIDYGRTVVKAGATVIFDGASSRCFWPAPAVGTHLISARHYDSSGNPGEEDEISVTIATDGTISWTDIIGRPASFRVVARGYSSPYPTAPGLYDGETNAVITGSGQTYMVVRLSRDDGSLIGSISFNLLTGSAAAQSMATHLNDIGPGEVVVVYTWDEPQNFRAHGGLLEAMYRHGASRAIFGSPQFKIRSAYILVGLSGCGEGNGFEAYQGAVDYDTNAWCDTYFQITGGNLLVSGTSHTPRTLSDYGYSGDLNATHGADWGTNVTGIPYATIYNNDDSAALGFNPTFSDWPAGQAYPTGWGQWANGGVIRDTAVVRVGTASVLFGPGQELGMERTVLFGAGLPAGTFVSGSVDIHIRVDYGGGLPGILVDLITHPANAGSYVRTGVTPPSRAVGVWQRVPWVARVAANEVIYGIRIYVMGAWGGLPGGNFSGFVNFDNLRFALFNRSLDNTTISVGADGVLHGAGGGQVTITGLGYAGDLDATKGAKFGSTLYDQYGNPVNQITTGLIGDGQVTEVLEASGASMDITALDVADGNLAGYRRRLAAELFYTAPSACYIIVTVQAFVSILLGDGNYSVTLESGITTTADVPTSLTLSELAVAHQNNQSCWATKQAVYSVPAGTTMYFRWWLSRIAQYAPQTNAHTYITNPTIKIEVIKK